MKQPGLANSRLAHHANNLPAAGLSLLPSLPDLLQFVLSSDKTCESAFRGDLEARTQWTNAKHLINIDWLAHASDSGRPQRFEVKIPFRQLVGLFAHNDRSGCRKAFHARRQAGCVTNGDVIGMEIILMDRAQNHLASVEADPDLEIHSLLAA